MVPGVHDGPGFADTINRATQACNPHGGVSGPSGSALSMTFNMAGIIHLWLKVEVF